MGQSATAAAITSTVNKNKLVHKPSNAKKYIYIQLQVQVIIVRITARSITCTIQATIGYNSASLVSKKWPPPPLATCVPKCSKELI